MRKYLLVLVTLSLVFMSSGAMKFDVARAAGNTYYIDSVNGNDTGAGTSPATAWKTLHFVNTILDGTATEPPTISAGDSFKFKRGQSFSGTALDSGALIIPESGSSGNNIIFSDYGDGARPKILASNNDSGILIHSGASYITIQNIDVKGANTSAITLNDAANNIEINNMNLNGVSASDDVTKSDGIQMTQGDIAHIRLSDITTTSVNNGVNASNFSSLDDFIINDSVFDNSDLSGIYVSNHYNGASAQNITIQNTQSENNLKYGLALDNCDVVSIKDSYFDSNGLDGVALKDLSDVVINNISSSQNGVSETSGFGSGVMFANVSTMSIMFSTMNTNSESGISSGIRADSSNYFDIPSSNSSKITVNRVTAKSNTINGIFLKENGSDFTASATDASANKNDGFGVHDNWTNVTFVNCLASSNGTVGDEDTGDGYGLRGNNTGTIENSRSVNNMKSNILATGASSVLIQNNILSNSNTPSSPSLMLSGIGTHTVYNNDIYSSVKYGHGVMLGGAPLSADVTTIVFDNNIIYGFDTAVSINHTEGSDVLGKINLTQRRNLFYNNNANLLGIQMGNSMDSDPKFTDPGVGDFSLNPGSAAIDAGQDVAVLTDYLGVSRQDDPCVANTGIGTINYYDIGAIEHTYFGYCSSSSSASPSSNSTGGAASGTLPRTGPWQSLKALLGSN